MPNWTTHSIRENFRRRQRTVERFQVREPYIRENMEQSTYYHVWHEDSKTMSTVAAWAAPAAATSGQDVDIYWCNIADASDAKTWLTEQYVLRLDGTVNQTQADFFACNNQSGADRSAAAQWCCKIN